MNTVETPSPHCRMATHTWYTNNNINTYSRWIPIIISILTVGETFFCSCFMVTCNVLGWAYDGGRRTKCMIACGQYLIDAKRAAWRSTFNFHQHSPVRRKKKKEVKQHKKTKKKKNTCCMHAHKPPPFLAYLRLSPFGVALRLESRQRYDMGIKVYHVLAVFFS